MEGIVRRENIDCGFERLEGYLVGADAPAPGGAVSDETVARMQHEHHAAVRAGVTAELLPAVPGLGVQLGPCVRYPGQAQLQPLQYLAGTAKVELALDAAPPPRERRSGAVAQWRTAWVR